MRARNVFDFIDGESDDSQEDDGNVKRKKPLPKTLKKRNGAKYAKCRDLRSESVNNPVNMPTDEEECSEIDDTHKNMNDILKEVFPHLRLPTLPYSPIMECNMVPLVAQLLLWYPECSVIKCQLPLPEISITKT